LLVVIPQVLFCVPDNYNFCDAVTILISFPGLPVVLLFSYIVDFSFHTKFGEALPVIALAIPSYFIIGAFFGWIYGKIKNRNKV